MSHAGQRQLMGASHGRDTQPDLQFKTYASAAFDEPINDDDVPSVIEHLAIVIGAHCLFLVTAVAIVGAGILLFSRF